MMINLHERVLAAPADTVGPLLDRLAGPADVLWPALAWPPIRLDRPLAVGADGGHGRIRYMVTGYEPGRRVEFRFHPAMGLDGCHSFEIEPVDGDSCVLRHLVVARPKGRMRVLVPLVVRWLHDALLEDLLDNAERAATGTVIRPYRYTPWVRLLRWLSAPRARVRPMPAGPTLVGTAFDRVDYADAYSIAVPLGVSTEPKVWADALFSGASNMPRLAETDGEVLLGADHGHLAYRVGVLVETGSERTTVTVATVVLLRSRAGRAYFAGVRLFHPRLVRLMLRRASRRLAGEATPVGSTAR